ncbi:MAG: Nucleoside triphosphate pyrophosphohydrolase [bacterium ADurb.Bin243]|nr:MAG: Nucleoside triphosphate pyrophosphohydrolase [bacterium ADurb.Bin243]HOD38987.1 nucleoside triphosphate pyrophosphohydrolase [Candidatus Wallbacteria bacterium]
MKNKRREEILHKFNHFMDVIDKLRDPEKGCPWDREQTLKTMKDFFLEECYELNHEIIAGDHEKTADELGDILLLISLCAKIGEEERKFDMGDILDKISHKLIERHPHVFGDQNVSDSGDVIKKWDEIKRAKRKKNISEDLVMSLPPLLWAYKVQKRLANIGFDFTTYDETLVKVREELEELSHEIKTGAREKIEGELGDMFFALINLSRHLSVNPETALVSSITKFIDRVGFIENNSEKHYGRPFKELTMAEMDRLWELAKNKPVMEER